MGAALKYLRDLFEKIGIELDRRTATSLLILLLLLILLPVGLFLIRNQINFLPRAAGELIQLGEGGCIKLDKNKKKVVDCTTVPLKLVNPFFDIKTKSIKPSATTSPGTSSSPAVSNSPRASVAGSASPSPSAAASVAPQIVRVTGNTNTEIQAAMDQVKDSGGAVYLPAGTYAIANNVKVYSNVTLFGDGIDQTILEAGVAIDEEEAVVGNDTSAGNNNVVIRDMTIKGHALGSGQGIKLRNLDGGFVVNVKTQGVDTGVLMAYHNGKGVNNVRVSNCQIIGAKTYGIFLSLGENNVIDNCTINSGGSDALGIGMEIAVDGKISGNRVISNTVSGGGHSLSFTAGNDTQYQSSWVNSGNIVCYNNASGNHIDQIWDQKGSGNVYVGNNVAVSNVGSLGFEEKGGTDPRCDVPAAKNIPAAPAKPQALKQETNYLAQISQFGRSVLNLVGDKLSDLTRVKPAFAGYGFSGVSIHECGEIISKPALSASEGDIVYKAPTMEAGKWVAHKTDGTTIHQEQMQFAHTSDAGLTGDAKFIFADHIDCKLFVTFYEAAGCIADPPPTGTNLTPGQTVTFHVKLADTGVTSCNITMKTTAPAGGAVTASPSVAPIASSDSDDNFTATSGDDSDDNFNNAGGSPVASSGSSPAPVVNPGGIVRYRLAESQEGLASAQWKEFALASPESHSKFAQFQEKIKNAVVSGVTALKNGLADQINWLTTPKTVMAAGFTSIDTSGCGEIISSPAAGAQSGDFVFRAPIRTQYGWETHKSDGTIIKTADIFKRLLIPFPETESNISRVFEEFTMSCNLVIHYDGDCTAEVVGPGTSKSNMLGHGETTTIHLQPGTDSSSGCDETVLIRARYGTYPPATYPNVTPWTWPAGISSRWCTDSDGGIVPNQTGIITNNVDPANGDPQTCNNGGNCTDLDKCEGSTLTEYYCENGLVKKQQIACSSACTDRWSCQANVTASPSPSPLPSPSKQPSPSAVASPIASSSVQTQQSPQPSMDNSGDGVFRYRLAETQAALTDAQWREFVFNPSLIDLARNWILGVVGDVFAQDSDDNFTGTSGDDSDDVFTGGSGNASGSPRATASAAGSSTPVSTGTPTFSIGKQFITTNFQLTDINPGAKQIWVQYMHPDGSTKVDHVTFDLVDKVPQVTGLTCNLDISKQNLKVTIDGNHFSDEIGKITTVSGSGQIEVLGWNNKQILGQIKSSGSITEGQRYQIKVVRTDGFESETAVCAVDKSLVSLGARIFCREPGKFDASDVLVTLLYNSDEAGNNNKVSKIEEKVSISAAGEIEKLKTQLQVGKSYAIAIKAPSSLRRSTTFTASEGTTQITRPDGTPFILPIGDIAPVVLPDGSINTLDRSELIRQWRVLPASGSATANNSKLTGDFNRDSKVNSIDWACMQYDFGSSDDPIPVEVPRAGSGTITIPKPASGTITIPVTSPTPRPSVSSNNSVSANLNLA